MYVLQVPLGMGFHDYTSSTILFFITCFWMGYVNPSAATRKIALLLPVVLFVTLVTTPRSYVAQGFMWELLGMSLMSLCVSTAVSLCVFPRFASIETQDRFGYALSRSSEVLELVMSAVLSTHRASAEVFLCEADSIVKNASDSQEAMGVRAFLSQLEPVATLRFIFRNQQILYNKYSPTELAAISGNLGWHLTSVIHAARNMNFNEYHAIGVENLRDEFLDTIFKYQNVIALVDCRAQDVERVDQAIEHLKTACDHMFATLSRSLKIADQRTATAAEDSFYDGINKKRVDIPSSCQGLDSSSFDSDAKTGANRLAFSFFLFHISELVQTVENKFHSKSTVTTPVSAVSPKPFVTMQDVLHMPVALYLSMFTHYATDYETKTKVALRTAFLMGIGLIFAEVPKMAMKFEQGQMCPDSCFVCSLTLFSVFLQASGLCSACLCPRETTWEAPCTRRGTASLAPYSEPSTRTSCSSRWAPICTTSSACTFLCCSCAD
jgi:hypothetical protein